LNTSGGRALLALQAHTLFDMSPRLRMMRSRDPDQSPPPQLYMAGGTDGWVGYVREDVGDAQARAIDELVQREPPVRAPGATPRFAEEYRAALGGEALSEHNFGPVHRLPRGLSFDCDAEIVCEGSAEGVALVERITREGVPRGLFDAGFVDLTHFWSPWVVAMAGGDVAAMAFCVRDGLMAREVGVFTVGDYRGRGYAAAVTAAWSNMHPRHPVLFYSTHRDNRSSQRVIARLQLPFLGESMRIA
jgi:hypothetical protein